MLTETLGPCGVGWKYEIVSLWTEQGSEGQVMCFAQVNLYHMVLDKWSEPIPGVGGSTLVAMEKNGLHTSDEGYKMAITDALSCCCKMIGVAADVYRGLSDSKYPTNDMNQGGPTGHSNNSNNSDEGVF